MLESDRQWRYYRQAIHEFDRRNAEKAKKIEKSES